MKTIKLTTITLKIETKERLRQLGEKGQSYDKLINKILNRIEVEKSKSPL